MVSGPVIQVLTIALAACEAKEEKRVLWDAAVNLNRGDLPRPPALPTFLSKP